MTLERYLEEHGLTATEFAGQIDVSPSTIIRLLAGERDPRLELLKKIHGGTNGAVTPNDFVPALRAEVQS